MEQEKGRKRNVAWPIFRLALALYVAFVFVRTPKDGFIAHNLFFWQPVQSANMLLGWTIVSDIMLSTLLSLLLAMLLFWKTVSGGVASSSKVEKVSLRLVDVAWYIGAAFALAVTISELQASWAVNQKDELRSRFEQIGDRQASLRQSIEIACDRYTEFGPIAPTTQIMTSGLVIADRFCGYMPWVEDPFGVSLDTICSEVDPPPRPRVPRRSYGRWYHTELLQQPELFRVLNYADTFCLNDSETVQLQLAISTIDELEVSGADMTQPFDWIWYFRLFSALIGFRLLRAIVDLKEEVAKAR